MKIMAAIVDPETNKVYQGKSHSEIIDEMEDADKSVFVRLRKIYVSEGSLPVSKHVGFVGSDGILLSRAESLKKWGVFYSQDIRRAR